MSAIQVHVDGQLATCPSHGYSGTLQHVLEALRPLGRTVQITEPGKTPVFALPRKASK